MTTQPGSPTTPSGSSKVTIKDAPLEIPEVTSQEIDIVLRNAEEIASSLQSETSRASSWITNAKLAIDVANRSFDEAGKLAHSVQMTAEEAAGKMSAVDIGSIDIQGKVEQDIVEKGSHIVDAVECTAIPSGNKTDQDLLGQDEVVKLQLRALQIQSLVEESREQLKETKTRLVGKTKLIATGMKKQADNLSDNLEVATHVIEERRYNADAEAILKGEAVEVDPKSLDKIDGVNSLKKTNSLDTTAAQAPSTASTTSTIGAGDWLKKSEAAVPQDTDLGAGDLLKEGGVLKADPASLDKIDGLPKRTHNADNLASTSHTWPHL